jgi:hypothetical protein
LVLDNFSEKEDILNILSVGDSCEEKMASLGLNSLK